MKRQKYHYNPDTLQFEKVKTNPKTVFIRSGVFILAAVACGFLLSYLSKDHFPSSSETKLKNELSQMEYNYELMNDEIQSLSKILNNIKKRDEGVYNLVLGVSPLDENIWNGGVGGHSNENLNVYADANLINNTRDNLHKLERQLVLFSQNMDEVEKLAEEKADRLESIPSVKPVREDKLNTSMSLLSGFGMRMHPVHKIMKMHQGLDFACPTGTAIIATGKGKVVKVEHKRNGFGKNIVIDHGYGYKTRYAHLSKILVKVGEKVEKGQTIGKVGNTGTSTASHLHYEVHLNGKPVDPIDFCLDGLSPEEYLLLLENANNSIQSFD